MSHKVEFYDEDHVWLNGKQFISLRRFGEAMREAREGGEQNCNTCLRQGCEYKDTGIVRINCPLWRASAV